MITKVIEKKSLKLILVLIACICYSTDLFAQTNIIPISDGGFETGATFGANGWTSNTGTPTQNQWVCNTGATAGFSGIRCAYVTNDTGSNPPPHTYSTGTTRVSHIYRDVTIPAGENLITLNFEWISQAETIWDRMRVWLVPTSYTPTYGTEITANGVAPTGRIQVGGNFSAQNTWTTANLTLPPAYGGTTFRLVFEWRNDGSLGTNPPAGVDDIVLTSDVIVPPPNDTCAGALPLTVNATCVYTQYTTLNAGDSGVADPGCADYQGGDVWFTVTVPASGSVIIDTDFGDITDGGMAVYTGNNCGALTLLECDDDDSDNGFMPSITQTGLTPGSTLYIRFWEYGNSVSGTFDICVTEPPPPPTNIDCNSADSITCGQTISATTTGTTGIASGVPVCSMSDYGVWYTFVGDGNQTTVNVTATGGFDTEMAVMTGSCGSLTNLSCQDSFGGTETYSFTSIVGQVYYVYVAYWLAGSTTTGDFTINLTCTPPNCTPGSGLGTSAVGLPSLSVGDISGNNPVSLACGAPASVDLEATYLQLGDPSDYSINSIPYAPPYQFDCLANQFSTFNDDTWSPAVSIGFNFCFYDNDIANILSQLKMAANAAVTFENPATGSSCGWDIEFDVPNAINADDFFGNYFFGRSIFGVHHDIDPSQGGEIGYELITLDTGERALIMGWHDVPMFLNNSILYTGMIVLYEHSNVIEVYIEEKNIDSGWNDGNAAVAIQRDANTGMAPANRNSLDPNWTASNEAWRFTPVGGGLGSISSITWYEGSATANGGTTGGLPPIGATDNITVNPVATTTYTAEVTYSFCDGNTLSYFEEVEVQVSGNKTWNGVNSTNWYDDGNWTPNGVPGINDCVVIPTTASGNQPIANIGLFPPPIPPAPGPTLARNVSVLDNAILTLEEDTPLVIDEWLNVAPDGIVHIKNSGSLIQIDDSVTNTGTVHVERSPNNDQSAVGNLDYVYWSTPVNAFDLNQISPGSTLLYEWTPTVGGNGAGNHGDWFAASGAMTTAKGYIIRGLSGTPAVIPGTAITVPNNTTLFSGTPHNGIITASISHGNYNSGPYTGNNGVNNGTQNEDDNWNLIGNPYPAAISADLFLDYNADPLGTLSSDDIIAGTVWLWPHDSQPGNNPDPFYEDFVFNYADDYIEYNYLGSNPPQFTSGHIASGQGFFVLMEHDPGLLNGNVVFTNAMRQLSAAYSNDDFLSPNSDEEENNRTLDLGERHRLWLNFSQEDNASNTLLVGYAEHATNAFDKMYDGIQLEGSTTSFYSLLDDQKLAIQGRGLPFDESDIIPLGFTISEAGSFAIGINSLDGLFTNEDLGIYLEDLELGMIHDLRVSPYSFSAEAGIIDNRFVLRYTNDTLGLADNALTDFTIVGFDAHIKVTASIPIESVVVYDLLGRAVMRLENINQTEILITNSQLLSSVYLVEATLSNQRSKVKKLVLH